MGTPSPSRFGNAAGEAVQSFERRANICFRGSGVDGTRPENRLSTQNGGGNQREAIFEQGLH